jgi:hypothetical protein
VKRIQGALVLGAIMTYAACAYGATDCLKDIYNGVESGKKFHPLWPFISGAQTVGTVVIATDPKKPQAYFGSIDAPDYRAIGGTAFPVMTIPFTTPTTCTSASSIGANVAFSQLDALSKTLTQGAKSQSLTATNSQVTGTQSQGSNATPGGSTSGNASGAAQPSTAAAGGTGTNSNPSMTQVQSDTYLNSTGVDFSHITGATLKITGLTVQFYNLPVLTNLNTAATGAANSVLNPTGVQTLSDKQTWIISRALTAATVEYTLTSSIDINASFLAQLISWLPGVKFKYANARTVTLTTTSPVTIGYKLWHPGTGFAGAATSPCSQHGCEIGGDDIDKDVFQQQ